MTLVVLLLMMKISPPGRTVRLVTLMVLLIAFTTTATFAFATSNDGRVLSLVLCTLVAYAAFTVCYIQGREVRRFMSKLVTTFSDRRRRS